MPTKRNRRKIENIGLEKEEEKQQQKVKTLAKAKAKEKNEKAELLDFGLSVSIDRKYSFAEQRTYTLSMYVCMYECKRK